MKETKTIAKAANFTATDFGKMSEIKDYTLELGPEIKIPGKVFGGQSVNATRVPSLCMCLTSWERRFATTA